MNPKMNPKRMPMKNTKNNSFYDKIYAAVCLIPRGRVATYGQVAALAGIRILPSAERTSSGGCSKRKASGWTAGTSTSGCISGAISEICIFRQTVV